MDDEEPIYDQNKWTNDDDDDDVRYSHGCGKISNKNRRFITKINGEIKKLNNK
jgi:hypothetical protein